MARARFSIIPKLPISLAGVLLDFDATTRQVRSVSGRAIRHPKQSAIEPLTDDVQLDPATLTVTGHFVDYPLYYGPLQVGFPGRARTLADALYDLQAKKIPCIVIAGDSILLSMVIESISESRTPTTGDAVDLDFTMAHIDIGELSTVAAVVDAQSQALGSNPPPQIGFKV